jgi:hypothetical protein
MRRSKIDTPAAITSVGRAKKCSRRSAVNERRNSVDINRDILVDDNGGRVGGNAHIAASRISKRPKTATLWFLLKIRL